MIESLLNDINKKQLRRNAIHEASHLVVLDHLDYKWSRVWINSTGGRVEGIQSPKHLSGGASIVNQTLIGVAGQVGEEIDVGTSLAIQSKEDYHHVLGKLCALGYSNAEAIRHVEIWEGQAKKILNSQWRKVERLATELERRQELSYTETVNILYTH